MKNLFLSFSAVLMLTQCGDNKKTYSYSASLPKELTEMKSRIDTLEQLNLPGTEEEIKAMKLNIAIAELNYLDKYEAEIRSKWIDENDEPMSNEELENFRREIKYDSIKTSLQQQIEIVKR